MIVSLLAFSIPTAAIVVLIVSLSKSSTRGKIVLPQSDRNVASESVTDQNNQELYKYRLRKHIMTSREEYFYKMLCEIFQNRWYVLPQVGLSTLLNHEVSGQNWYGAFQHINRKTVDYVLLSKSDLSVVCAIELDDYTHDRRSRKQRDSEVERIFKSVNLPLVRFRNISNLSQQDIVNQIAAAIKSTNRT